MTIRLLFDIKCPIGFTWGYIRTYNRNHTYSEYWLGPIGIAITRKVKL